MIGKVRSMEPRLCVTVLGPTGRATEIDALLDTGAVCDLTLPSFLICELELVQINEVKATLAGDVTISSGVFEAQILWYDKRRNIVVHQLEGAPLLGNGLLMGHHIEIDLVEGGTVEITPL